MKTIFAVAGIMTIGCAAPISANAQSCPPGHVLRVSMGVCVPRFVESETGPRYRDSQPLMRTSSARPEVGDIVLFGSRSPTLLKPVTPKQAARRPAHAPAIAKAPSRKSVVAEARSSKVELPAQAPLPPRIEARQAPEPVEPSPAPDVKVAAVETPRVEAAPERVAPPPIPVEAPRVREPIAAPVARKAPPSQPVEQMAALGSGNEAPLAYNAPSMTPQPPAPLMQHAEPAPPAALPREARLVPAPPKPETSAPAAPGSSLPDWGDEKKLVEALRANWKSPPLTRSFQRGDEVPADLPLQPLPQPFASRDASVNMHYLMSNGDAVLVLPGMRVVVDVYHSATASLP
jgi:hypothetical protein